MATKEKKSTPKKSDKSSKKKGKFVEFLKSQGFARLRGTAYMLLAVFTFIALISFFVKGCPVDDVGENWMGVVGGWLSKALTVGTFGLGAFGLTFLLFVYGLRLWGWKPMSFGKAIGVAAFWMLWLATMAGYVVGSRNGWEGAEASAEAFAGVVGMAIAGLMNNLVKWFTVVILVFFAIAMLVFVHKLRIKIDFAKLKEKMAELAKQREERRAAKAALRAEEEARRAAEAEEAQKQLEEEEKAEQEKQDNVTDVNDDDFESFVGLTNPAPEPEQPKEEDGDGPTFTIDYPSEPPAVTPEPEIEDEYSDEDLEGADDEDYAKHFSVNDIYDPRLELHDYQMPTTDILRNWEEKNVKVTEGELRANKDRIVKTLKDYGIEIDDIHASPGPTVTLYEIKPKAGIRISKIKSLEDDIALSLAATGIRIIAPIPGKGTVGIEVPNSNPQIVSMKTMLECDAFRNNKKMELPIALGKTISNEPFVTDLTKMPHLLMAGATGTGKSVGLNAVIASLLYKKHPAELKFVMVDPKKVELSLYSKIERHYLAELPDADEPIITDVKKVVRTLNSLCIEMDHRYDLLKLAHVRKITEYNDKFIHRRLNPENGHHYMPYIVLIVDEFADLIMTVGKEVETPICRLAQLARAVGIHLIIATQRPTTNIITGTIKANFPARIAFKVTSGIDSRTILDVAGAQRLIGRGDMLISLSGSDLVRLQCALMETEECDSLADFIGNQHGYPEGFQLPEYLDETDEPTKDFDPNEKDEFFNDAARLVVAGQFGSTSLLQRKLKLGYARSGRIMDQLEAAGIVGPSQGSKAREVLIKDEVQLEELLRNI